MGWRSHVRVASPRVPDGTISLHLRSDIGICVGITLVTCSKHLKSDSRRNTPSTTSCHGGKVRRPVVRVEVIFEDRVDDIPVPLQSSTKNIQHVAVLTFASMIMRSRQARKNRAFSNSDVVQCRNGRGGSFGIVGEARVQEATREI